MIFALLLLPQEAAALPQAVHSYYRLERDGRHVGYAAEVYEPGKGWARRRVDGDVLQEDRADARRLSSLLPDTRADLERTPEDRIARFRSFEIPLEALPPPLEPTLYRLRQEGRLAAPGRIVVSLPDLSGDRPRIREAAMDVGTTAAVRVFGRSVRLTTIVFPEGTDYTTVRVDGYGRIVDGRRRDGSSLKLVVGEAEAVGALPFRLGSRTSCSKNPDGTWRRENLPR